ncbi:MAG TPA: hypothetical protein VNQ90_04600 [Chthoniobacteraceae bacterium]|nr:hypothetical protein [Chthoniobacteraceae bacterium]
MKKAPSRYFFLAGIGLVFFSVGLAMFVWPKGWSRSSAVGMQKEVLPSSREP